MATSGSATVNVASAGGSYANGVRLRLSWEERSQSVANNTTTVRFTLQVITGQYGAMQGSAQQTWKISCAGKSTSGHFTIQQGNSTTKTLETWDVVIKHESDGTGSFSATFSASFNMNFNGWVGTKSGSLKGTLERIARASTPSVSGTLRLGSAITIKTNRASSSFTHTLRWSWAGHSGTIATGVGASTTWTPSIATFAPYLTDATSATCTITCVTYSGSTNIGSKTKTFTLSIPTSVRPSISAVALSDSTGLHGTYGSYVQNMSNITAAITASGSYGSTISSYRTTMDGITASGRNAALGKPANSGTRKVAATVTDSRGRTATMTVNASVVPYTAPSVTSASAYRYDAATGQEDDESTTARAEFTASWWNIAGAGTNTLTSTIYYRAKGSSSWTQIGQWHDNPTGGAVACTASHSATVSNASETSRYEFRMVLSDAVGSTVETTVEVGTAQPFMDWKGDGEGMAFFAIADQFGIKMGKPIYLAKESAIKAEASDGTWHDIIKLQGNGRMILANHPSLENDSFLTAMLSSGNVTRLIGLNSSNKVELNWTTGGMRGRVYKEIWSGSYTHSSTGTITVPELPYYNVILLKFDARDARIVAVRNFSNSGSAFLGVSAFTSDTAMTLYSATLKLRSDTVIEDLRLANRVNLQDRTTTGTLVSIEGIL